MGKNPLKQIRPPLRKGEEITYLSLFLLCKKLYPIPVMPENDGSFVSLSPLCC
jgi:hypothetical protein